MASTTGAAIRMLVSGLRYGARPGWIAIAILSVGVTDGASAQAQTAIKTDASWGRTAQTLAPGASATSFLASSGATLSVPGNLYTIPQTLGQKAGANLFHSFESFRVGTGDAALFTTTESFNNVISRVSGSSATTINGILALQPAAGSKPNFFFINPNGVAFGAGAQVDVPAAFHVSTANELRFTGNTVFRAGAGADSTLTVAPPVAFGFLGTTRAPVLVTDGTLLQTARGAGISVIGGDVEINNGVLFAPGGGDVRVAAVGAGAAEIALTGPLPVLHGTLNVVNGGVIVTASSGARDSGSIAVSGGEVTVDGQGSGATFTGISSVAAPGGTGNAGNVTVTAAGRLSVVDGAIISSDSFSLARTGSVTVRAGSVLLDSRGNTDALDAVGEQTDTAITSCACLAGSDAGAVTVIASGDITILDHAQISSITGGDGKAGPITVRATDMTLDNQRSRGIFSFDGGPGGGADLDIAITGRLRLLNGAAIAASTFQGGDAGNVSVKAGSLEIDEQSSPEATGIFSTAELHSIGNAGDVAVSVAGHVSIVNGGAITSDTFGRGRSGSITVHADSMYIDGQDSSFFTGMSSQANDTASGNAGAIDVSVTGALSLVNGGSISSRTFSVGDAAAITVKAGSIDITGRVQGPFTGIFASAEIGSSGRSADIDVTAAGTLTVQNHAFISSLSASPRDAGSVKVTAGDVFISGIGPESIAGIFATTANAGNAGNVDLSVKGTVKLVDAGTITASTSGAGSAGSIKVAAQNIVIDGLDDPKAAFGIQAGSLGASSGNAGNVTVSATQSLSLVRRGFISVSTHSAVGRSGSVTVDTANLVVDGTNSQITARAHPGSSGQTGSVTVKAAKSITLSNGGALAMQNDATVADPASVQPTLISASAPSIALTNNGQITAESTGNVAASDIQIRFADRLVLDPSRITTSANQGNGGSILIGGPGVLILDHSQITTSVSGLSGNGGDITVHAGTLVMNTGFIQANTAGAGARGGNVAIDVQTFVPSGGTVAIGGATPLVFQGNVFGLNVIQAAAPTGVSGRIDVNTPVSDIAGSLHSLSTELVSFGALGKDLCRVGASSSLTPLGRGGLRPASVGFIRPESPSGAPEKRSQDTDATPSISPANQQVAQRTSSRCEQ